MSLASLQTLDESITGIAAKLHAALVSYGAEKLRFCYRVTPDGGVTAPDFWFGLADGSSVKDFPPTPERRLIGHSVNAHWRLTQDLGLPRWYMMTVQLARSGRYSVDFEYRDDYQVGDIMKDVE